MTNSEDKRHGLGDESPGREAQCLSRDVVEPVRVVHYAQKGPLPREFCQQA